jgi:hypothetical protein
VRTRYLDASAACAMEASFSSGAPAHEQVSGWAPVQIAGLTEMFPIDMDTLAIEQDSIPDSGRSGIFEPEHGEVELLLANAVH